MHFRSGDFAILRHMDTVTPRSRTIDTLKWLDDVCDEPEPPEPPDLTRPVRKLAAAILLQAVLDSKRDDERERRDAVEFLNPRTAYARYHLLRMAECANVELTWLLAQLRRTANQPLPAIHCIKGKLRKTGQFPGA